MSINTISRFTAVLLLALFSISMAGFAQNKPADEKIILKYNFANGETVNYISRLKGMAAVNAAGVKTGSSTDIAFETTSRVTVQSPGVFRVESKKTGARIFIDGKQQANPPDTVTSSVLHSDGRISEGSGRNTGNPYQVKLPEGPVSVGHKWQHNEKMNFKVPTKELQDFEVRTIYSLDDVRMHKGRKCAVISVKSAARKAVEGDISVKISGTGEIYFDIDNGRIITAVNVVKADLGIDQTGKDGKPARILEMKSRNTAHLSLR